MLVFGDSQRALREDWFTVALMASEFIALCQSRYTSIFWLYTGKESEMPTRKCVLTVSRPSESPFHQAMANSALHLAKLRGPADMLEESPTAIHYHQLAVSSVRTQLEESEGQATEETLACVAAFLCWTVRVLGHFQSGRSID